MRLHTDTQTDRLTDKPTWSHNVWGLGRGNNNNIIIIIIITADIILCAEFTSFQATSGLIFVLNNDREYIPSQSTKRNKWYQKNIVTNIIQVTQRRFV